MNIEQRLLNLKQKLESQPTMGAAKTSQRELDVNEAEEIITEAIELIHGLKVLVVDIKALLEGVKWYQLMKLASIVQKVIQMIKQYEWSLK